MNQHAPLTRLDVLRFLERVQERDLARTRSWIADEERREAERRRGEERRPPPAEWLIEHGLNPANVVAVHRGDCWDPGKRHTEATRAQALDALRQQVPACSKCRPDTSLGFLE